MFYVDKQSPITHIDIFTSIAKGNATPHDASTPQAQPATVDDDSPTNAGNSEDPILEFEDNEHNHQVLDELFELLLEVPEMTGEYILILIVFSALNIQ